MTFFHTFQRTETKRSYSFPNCVAHYQITLNVQTADKHFDRGQNICPRADLDKIFVRGQIVGPQNQGKNVSSLNLKTIGCSAVFEWLKNKLFYFNKKYIYYKKAKWQMV